MIVLNSVETVQYQHQYLAAYLLKRPLLKRMTKLSPNRLQVSYAVCGVRMLL